MLLTLQLKTRVLLKGYEKITRVNRGFERILKGVKWDRRNRCINQRILKMPYSQCTFRVTLPGVCHYQLWGNLIFVSTWGTTPSNLLGSPWAWARNVFLELVSLNEGSLVLEVGQCGGVEPGSEGLDVGAPGPVWTQAPIGPLLLPFLADCSSSKHVAKSFQSPTPRSVLRPAVQIFHDTLKLLTYLSFDYN